MLEEGSPCPHPELLYWLTCPKPPLLKEQLQELESWGSSQATPIRISYFPHEAN